MIGDKLYTLSYAGLASNRLDTLAERGLHGVLIVSLAGRARGRGSCSGARPGEMRPSTRGP